MNLVHLEKNCQGRKNASDQNTGECNDIAVGNYISITVVKAFQNQQRICKQNTTRPTEQSHRPKSSPKITTMSRRRGLVFLGRARTLHSGKSEHLNLYKHAWISVRRELIPRGLNAAGPYHAVMPHVSRLCCSAMRMILVVARTGLLACAPHSSLVVNLKM